MPHSKHGQFNCPGCGAEITITRHIGDSDLLSAHITLVINKWEEEGPEAPGDVRSGDLPEGVHAGVHGQAPGKATKG